MWATSNARNFFSVIRNHKYMCKTSASEAIYKDDQVSTAPTSIAQFRVPVSEFDHRFAEYFSEL